MPEGDTLYRTAESLRRAIQGRCITAARCATGALDAARLVDRRVKRVEARGKHLLIFVEDELAVHSHLGMTGSWHVYGTGERWRKPARHAALVMDFEGGQVVVCFTPKTLELLSATQLLRHRWLSQLGPDILAAELDVAEVTRRFRIHNRAQIGVAIMNQSIVRGVGNVYKSELLFLRRVNPFAIVENLTDEQLTQLVGAARELMQKNRWGYPRTTRFAQRRATPVGLSPCRATLFEVWRHHQNAATGRPRPINVLLPNLPGRRLKQVALTRGPTHGNAGSTSNRRAKPAYQGVSRPSLGRECCITCVGIGPRWRSGAGAPQPLNPRGWRCFCRKCGKKTASEPFSASYLFLSISSFNSAGLVISLERIGPSVTVVTNTALRIRSFVKRGFQMYRKPVSLLSVAVVLAATCQVYAWQEDVAAPAEAAAGDGCCTTTCTVMVPQRVMETRTRCVTKYRQEQRPYTYNVVRCVPETREVEENYTVMVPEQRTRTVNYMVSKPVTEQYEVKYMVRKPVTEQYEVQYMVRVPQQEQRTGHRMVRRVVQEQRMRTVVVRGGHWETRSYEVCGVDACGCPVTRTCCRRCWVPTCETREVPYTVCRTVCEQVPFTYCVTTYRCEPRTRTACRTRYVCEERSAMACRTRMVCESRSREVCYTVCVPQQRTRKCCVTTYRRVCEPRTANYTVCVPYTEQEAYQVCVCRMVATQVEVPSGGCGCGGCGCGDCGGCGCGGCGCGGCGCGGCGGGCN